MVIPVRSSFIRIIILLFGICPLWADAAEQEGELHRYGPIIADDTLAEISIKLKGDSPWHYQRWMYVIYLNNPNAFFGENMNNLKLGAMLKVPSEEELQKIELAEAFRAVKIHLYILQQQRQEKRTGSDESDGDLLLRARLQRLFTTNQMMQKESGELFERIAALEQEMGSVVDKVLDSEQRETSSATQSMLQMQQDREQSSAAVASTGINGEQSEASGTWWLLLLSMALIYTAGFFWRRRLEAAL